MPEKDKIFLTPQETLAAIRTDFSQYAPQKHLFLELGRIIIGRGAALKKDDRGEGVWMEASTPGHMRFVSFRDLGEYLCGVLEKALPSPDLLSEVGRRVFQTAVYTGRDENGKSEGIWIETGMEGFTCRQCGYCCRTLEFHNECTIEDYLRWEAMDRQDIMKWVGLVRRAGKIVSCQIWVKPGTRQYADGCPWLRNIPDQNRHECLIHEVRPEICRQYPGSRKHAVMTGCIGFSRQKEIQCPG